MYNVTVGKEKQFKIELDSQNNAKGTINGKTFDLDILEINENELHILRNNKSFNVDIVEVSEDKKELIIKINGQNYHVNVKDKFDILLENLGMENMKGGMVKEVKAPMPGLVVNINVSPGEEVAKNDTLLVLEAMKMENIIKSPSDGKIKVIRIAKGDAVEKNQILVEFE